LLTKTTTLSSTTWFGIDCHFLKKIAEHPHRQQIPPFRVQWSAEIHDGQRSGSTFEIYINIF